MSETDIGAMSVKSPLPRGRDLAFGTRGEVWHFEPGGRCGIWNEGEGVALGTRGEV